MNKRLYTILSDKCKDMGLTEEELQKIAAQFGDGLTDESTEEEWTRITNQSVETAKLMQSVATRWVNSSQKKQTTEKPKEGGSNGGQNGGNTPDVMEQMKKLMEEKFSAMKSEFLDMQTKQQAQAQRSQDITAKAKDMGIPDDLLPFIHIGEDEDIDSKLTSVKQVLVNNRLQPANAAGIKGSSEESVKDEAKQWADGLPNA